MRLLIFGASGRTGQHLTSRALEQGHHVTAFSRHPEKIKQQHPNLSVIQGNVADHSAVENAVAGQDVVLSALGAAGPFKFDKDVVDGMNNIIRAMETKGVSRLIYLSFIGVGEGRSAAGFIIRNIAPKLLKTEIEGHRQREQMIEKSKLQWTIVQAPTLTNGRKKGVYRTGTNIFSKGFFVGISRADVADCMLSEMIRSHYLHARTRIMY